MNRKEFIKTGSLVGLLPFVPLSSNSQTPFTGGPAKVTSPSVENSYWYIGHLLSVLLNANDTGGSFALLHGYEVRGLEPPPHTHTREDESFYLLSGEIRYFVGDQTFDAKKGDCVFLPKNIQHHFQVLSETSEVLIHLSPAGFENYFIEMSEPAKELVIPPKPEGAPDIQKLVETAKRYGILFHM